MDFNSRRSVVVCKNGCVASSQPLASQIGIDILKKGGNAADAAIAMAAALNLVEPCSTGFSKLFLTIFVKQLFNYFTKIFQKRFSETLFN